MTLALMLLNIYSSYGKISDGNIDLFHTEISVSTNPIIRSSYVFVNSKLNSTGNAGFGYHYTGYYLSQDTILNYTGSSDGDVLLTYSFINGQSSPATIDESVQLSIPSYVSPGSYYILVATDAFNYIAETNEANNIATLSVTVLAEQMDLSIQNVSLNSSTATAGGNLSVSYSLYNLGQSDVSSSYTGFYLSSDSIKSVDDRELTSQYEYYLAGNSFRNSTYNFVLESNLPGGNYFLIVQADKFSLIEETNENNNYSYAPLQIIPATIDLTISSISLSSSQVEQGRAVTLNFRDTNIGNYFAYNHEIGIYLSSDTIVQSSSDIFIKSLFSGSIEAGSFTPFITDITIPSSLAAGSYYILIADDIYNEVSETNETNNIGHVSVTVKVSDIDLQVKTAKVGQSNVIAGTSIKISNYIYNAGTSLSFASYTNYYLSSDQLLGNDDIYLSTYFTPEIAGESSYYMSSNVTIPFETLTGTYYILFYADAQNIINETNEDNIVAKAIRVTARSIDLSIRSGSVSKLMLAPGEEFKVKSTIENSGNIDATFNYLGYFLSADNIFSFDDRPLGLTSINGVGENSSATYSANLSIPSDVSAGNYYIIFVADLYNYVSETIESNNVLAKLITVTTPALREALISTSDTSEVFESTVAPNPVEESIHIFIEGIEQGESVRYELYDLTGNLHASDTIILSGPGFSIPAASLTSGIYLLKLESKRNIRVLRLIKN
jgi:subtilase family serine protease